MQISLNYDHYNKFVNGNSGSECVMKPPVFETENVDFDDGFV